MQNLNLNEMQSTEGGHYLDKWDCTASDGDGIVLGMVTWENYDGYAQMFFNLNAIDHNGIIPTFGAYLQENCVFVPYNSPITIMI